MADVRHIIVSDLHLGASNSILTKLTADFKGTVPHEPSELLVQYVECLLHIVGSNAGEEPVTLILNGDFLELALAGLNEASMVFEGFINLLWSDPRSSRLSPHILCIAGNHDHHLWNAARETRYTDKYLPKAAPDRFLDQERYITRMVEGPRLRKVPVDLLNALIHRFPKLSHLRFETIYPNYALINSAGTRGVVIHHGHFVESIYSLMTSLKDGLFADRTPVTKLAELEAENGAWIDFFWSALGRSGQVGADIELVYDKMQDPRQLGELFRNLATSMSQHVLPGWKWGRSIKVVLLAGIFRLILGRMATREVRETGAVLSADAQAGLSRYLQDFLLSAMREENDGTLPPEMSFVFGHTHKPFEDLRRFDGYAEEVQVLNSGGWVVDTLLPDPLHGGAIIVLDEELNAASFRLYNEADEAAARPVQIVAAPRQDQLADALRERIDLGQSCWATFPGNALAAVKEHRQNLRFKIGKS